MHVLLHAAAHAGVRSMDMEDLIGSWSDVRNALVGGVLAYAALLLLVRLAGKRAVAKWNAFGLIVTVALGSALANAIASGTLLTGVGAFATLLGLQFVITWLAVRVAFVGKFVKARPALLVRQGELLKDDMKRERVTEDEVMTAVRRRGFADLRDVAAVVLETDGSFSVIEDVSDDPAHSTLAEVAGAEWFASRKES